MTLKSYPTAPDEGWEGDHIFEPVLAKTNPLTSFYRAGCSCGWRGEGLFDNSNRATMSRLTYQWDTEHAVTARPR